MITALVFLVGACLLGTGLIRRAAGRWLDHAEQSMWGLVAGWMLTTVCAYLVARSLGRLSWGAMMVLLVVVWVVAVALWLPVVKLWMHRRTRLRALWRNDYAGLLLVLLLFAPILIPLFRTRMLEQGSEGIYSGGSSWYDMGWHMAISTSFVYGQNFPAVYTPFPPAPLLYPFLPDFQTALLMSLGMSMQSALIATAVPLALSVVGLFYSLARRITETFAQGFGQLQVQASAVLATILFLFNGGLGFLYFFENWRKSKQSFAEFWSRLDVNYANMGGEQIQWTNLIADTLLPQRTSLYGIPVALMVFTVFACAWQNWSDEEARERERGATTTAAQDESEENGREIRRHSNWRAAFATNVRRALSASARPRALFSDANSRLLALAGVLTGLLPLFHTHSYMAVGLVSGFLFLLRPRRAWLAFWLPAVVVALPHFMSLTGHVASTGFMRWQPGWRGHNETNWPLYWLRNIGIPLLVVVPACYAAPRAWRKFYLAFVALMAVAMLVVFTPNDYDNIKLMYYWYAATSILVAAWLVRLGSVHRQRTLAAFVALASVASGLLAVQYESLNYKIFFNHEEIDAARFVREQTAPRALFLTASTVHQPILSLAGRAVVRGDTAWLWSHGYDFPQREADVKAIYAGRGDALELLRYYRVDYVYLGETERKNLYANQQFFEQYFPVVYRNARVTIYDARPPEIVSQGAHDGTRHALAAPAPREYASRLSTDPAQLLVAFPRAAFALYRLHRISYGRMPRYYDFMTDAAIMGRGVSVGATGWEQKLEENKHQLTEAWTNRVEFKQLHEGRTDEQFVDALYANAGVTPSQRERAAMVAALERRTDSRASVLRRVAENRQLYRQQYDAAYVLMHYFGYLRRSPDDPPDNNLEGFNFWLQDLQRTGDYRSVSRVFIEAGEYKDQIKR